MTDRFLQNIKDNFITQVFPKFLLTYGDKENGETTISKNIGVYVDGEYSEGRTQATMDYFKKEGKNLTSNNFFKDIQNFVETLETSQDETQIVIDGDYVAKKLKFSLVLFCHRGEWSQRVNAQTPY